MEKKKWWKKLFRRNTNEVVEINFDDLIYCYTDLYFRELAFWGCVNLVSKTLSKCEFKTYVKGKSTKDDEYYLWNIEPNQNQSSSDFMHKLLAKLFQNNEALVISSFGQLFVADSYNKKPYTLYEDIFTDVSVEGFSFTESFTQSEVLYFKLSHQNMRYITNGIYNSYQQLIDFGLDGYKKQSGAKYKLSIDTNKVGKIENLEDEIARLTKELQSFMKSKDAAYPEFSGYNLEEMGSKTYRDGNSRDIKNLYNDVFEFTAIAFGIPPSVITGGLEHADKAMELFITNAILPLKTMLEEEINRKRSGKTAYLQGTYLKIDTKHIKYVDLLNMATATDKLISSGAYSINEIREVCGDEPLVEDWANEHFMTKNYTSIDDLINDFEKGGE